MCNMCEERIVVGDEEYCLAGRDCSKRLSFADKCKNEIAEAKEEVEYFSNSSQARKIWTYDELLGIVKKWQNHLHFWEDQLANCEGDK